MVSLVWAVIALLVATKVCDFLSTWNGIRNPCEETNPVARRAMERLGMRRALCLVLAASLVVIGVAGQAALAGGTLRSLAFVVVGSAVSLVQGAVALANWTGRDNPVTRGVRSFHAWLSGLRQG
jgi:hypothetical protein